MAAVAVGPVNAWQIAVLAALAMAAEDIVGVIGVQAEATNRGWLAGWADVVGWYVGIVCTTISVTTLNSGNLTAKALVLVLVGASNLFGTKAGQMLGHRLMRRKAAAQLRRTGLSATDTPVTLNDRVRYIEQLLGVSR